MAKWEVCGGICTGICEGVCEEGERKARGGRSDEAAVSVVGSVALSMEGSVQQGSELPLNAKIWKSHQKV